MADNCKVLVIHSRSASQASTTSTFSSRCEGDEDVPHVLNNVQIRGTSKIYCTPTRKAKRIRFFRNGDRFFKGVVMPVTPERYRSFDSLLSDVTHTLKGHVNLPNGVRAVYNLEGNKVSDINDLEDGKCYVCSGPGEPFKRIEYLNLSSRKVKPIKPLNDVRLEAQSPRTTKTSSDFIRPKVITLVRSGTKPRKIIRLLLNKRNARSFEHALSSITDAVKLDTGAVRKVFNMAGNQIFNLQQFFEFESVFFVYGSERFSQDDLHLDSEGRGQKPSMKRTLNQSNDQRYSQITNLPEKGLRYEFGKTIGNGNFAVVRQCIDRFKNEKFAVKIINKSKLEGEQQILENEVDFLLLANHPNIIRLIDQWATPSELYLVMELEEGDLSDVIAGSKKFPKEESRFIIKHLSSALFYLHQKRIVHRDVKPENLLVRLDENKKIISVKLGDFGLAQVVTEPLYSICGTPTYVAPEILSETGYKLEVDVWAAGIILYILLCGYAPFRNDSEPNDQEELFDKILTGKFEFNSPDWDDISNSAKNLICNMLQLLPESRYTAEDVLNHPWLKVNGNEGDGDKDRDEDGDDNLHLDDEEHIIIETHETNGTNVKRTALLTEGKHKDEKLSMKRSLNHSNDQRDSQMAIHFEKEMRYEFGKSIGSGNFAVVRQCIDRFKDEKFAVKIIDKSKWEGKEQILENEVDFLLLADHPNIIRLIDQWATPYELYLVMELEEGDLFDVIASSKKFPVDKSRLIIKHLSSALDYLHQRRIVHRDVKPENLLVRLDENKKVISVKLGDFGLAQVVTEPLYSVCGTPPYVAPEILSETGYKLEVGYKVCYKVDIWATGVLMYILLCGYAPFRCGSEPNNQEKLFDKILTGKFEFNSPDWDDISNSAKNLICNMLQLQPESRCTAEDVLNHPWLKAEKTNRVSVTNYKRRIARK